MSSSDLAISVRGLSKAYTIRHNKPKHTTFADALIDRLKNPFQASAKELFWALQDVNFEVNKGEIVGIIGRNGAGKSTLLKILSRIVRPSRGIIDLYGRVGSLLEVGTGFHQELTGRENIHLNGAILGMNRAEISRRFDEIVAFAEIEQFLDTPVKRYSSGMYVRLAFAVAAHLEPEILIVDEVLAVGDAQFQAKCLGKMKDVAGHGRTVLFVSHNLGAVRNLCSRGILLQNGRLTRSGTIEEVTAAYLNDHLQASTCHTKIIQKQGESRSIWVKSVSILCNGQPKAILETGDKLAFTVAFQSIEPTKKPIIGYLIRSSRGENAVNANNYFLPSPGYLNPVTTGIITCNLDHMPLMADTYSVSIWLCVNPHEQHHLEDVLHFTVEEKDIWGSGALPTKSLSCFWWPTQFAFDTHD